MEGNKFWGLVIKPGKRYRTTVQEPFRITKVCFCSCTEVHVSLNLNCFVQACIEPATVKDGSVTSVYFENEFNKEFIIANLNLKNFNEGLDLSFNEGEKICFKGNHNPITIFLEI